MDRTTGFETGVRVNGAGVGAGGETFQVSGEYLAHTLLLTGIVFSEAFGLL